MKTEMLAEMKSPAAEQDKSIAYRKVTAAIKPLSSDSAEVITLYFQHAWLSYELTISG